MKTGIGFVLILVLFITCKDSTKTGDQIGNDVTPPSVIILHPADGLIVTEPLTIKVDATDNVGIAKVVFMIDGDIIGEDNSQPYEQFWNVGYWADGAKHTVFAKAVDYADNVGQSEVVLVKVSKKAGFVPELIYPTDNAVIKGEIKLLWASLSTAVLYQVQISLDTTFSSINFDQETADTSVIVTPLDEDVYYWRVRAKIAELDWNNWSTFWSFVTNIPPAKVTLVPKNPDTSDFEHGIDAIYEVSRPEVNSIILEWYHNKEIDLAGYEIYRSEYSGKNYTSIGRVTKSFNVIDTTFTDNSTTLQKRYYYYVIAFDELDQLSEPSDTVNYKLVEVPSLSSPVGNIGNNFSPIFTWDFHPNYIPHTFIFRLEKVENEAFNPLHIVLFELGVNYDPHQEWQLSDLTSVNSLNVGNYRWRIDPMGSEEMHGGESAWREFSIQ